MPTIRRRLGAVTFALAGSLCAAGHAAAADETAPPADITINGSLAGVTDYRFRGLSRSGGDPAVQGGISVSHVSGAYAGVWSSSLSLDRAGPLNPAVHGNQELDLYGGWTGPVASGVTADVGLLYYAFPSGHAGKAEFFEPYASLSGTLGPATAKVGVAYAWKQRALNFNGGRRDDNLYVYADLNSGIPGTRFSLSAHLGYTDGALSPKYATGETADYRGGFDWSAGAGFAVSRNISLGAQYVGVEGRGIRGFSDDTVVGTVKLSF